MSKYTGPLGHAMTCFKAYDVRGRVPEELDAGTAYRIARAWAGFIGAQRVCMGRDYWVMSPPHSRTIGTSPLCTK